MNLFRIEIVFGANTDLIVLLQSIVDALSTDRAAAKAMAAEVEADTAALKAVLPTEEGVDK